MGTCNLVIRIITLWGKYPTMTVGKSRVVSLFIQI